MKQQQPVRVLPADVYDALELSAIANGGIGRGDWATPQEDFSTAAPHCLFGHAEYAAGEPFMSGRGQIVDALKAAGLNIGINDAVLYEHFGKSDRRSKVSWDEYVKIFNIVRGEEPTNN